MQQNYISFRAVTCENIPYLKMIYNVGDGYYTIDELCNAIAGSIAITDNNQAYMVSESAQWVDLGGASDTANILKLEHKRIPFFFCKNTNYVMNIQLDNFRLSTIQPRIRLGLWLYYFDFSRTDRDVASTVVTGFILLIVHT